ncbi:hypothetical protein BP6252_03044 [Coleophoma cylindrospora]|uniref:Major facilitator superfamily (MFS) profile domain-containing protein n=1 Tax=Coleophoma cylindrospora TaxID=1849047 RepID=A0A3D8S6L6_9HELO|nr:hypothetical protein BP6252_03044 [Coleophoma cylindrospora]
MSELNRHPSHSTLTLQHTPRPSQEATRIADPEKGGSVPKTPSPDDWDGPDDPENPLNWSRWKRLWHVVPPALVSFTATFASSVYTPAFSEIKSDFHVGSTVAILPLSLYVLALGAGPILAAPISETYGRHVVYLISAPLGALFTMGAGFSPSIAALCILRFFAGLTFSPALAIGAGTIADVNRPEHRATPTSIYILMPFLGPSLGPVIGSFVSVRKSWRWTQWTIIFFAIFSMLSVLTAQETYKKTILLRRAQRLHIPPPPSPFPTSGARIKFLISVTLIRPLHMLFTEPIVGFLSLYTAFNFSVLFSFFAAFPYVFRSVYHFSTIESGLVFISIGIGCLLAATTAIVCDKVFYQPQVALSHAAGNNGVVAPEYRLYPAMFGSIGLPLGLFWFAWTAKADIHWIAPVLSAIPFAWGNLAIFIAAATYLVDTYQALTGASAMAANGLLRYTFGAVFPLFTLQMYAGMGIGWATSLLGFVTVALMPIPWVIFKWGHSIRMRSSYDTLKA